LMSGRPEYQVRFPEDIAPAGNSSCTRIRPVLEVRFSPNPESIYSVTAAARRPWRYVQRQGDC
jgi:hypothetical protein